MKNRILLTPETYDLRESLTFRLDGAECEEDYRRLGASKAGFFESPRRAYAVAIGEAMRVLHGDRLESRDAGVIHLPVVAEELVERIEPGEDLNELRLRGRELLSYVR